MPGGQRLCPVAVDEGGAGAGGGRLRGSSSARLPTAGQRASPLILAAAYVAGVDEVFTLGGALAVAALAFGTEGVRVWTRS